MQLIGQPVSHGYVSQSGSSVPHGYNNISAGAWVARVDRIIVKLGGPCGTVNSTEWAARSGEKMWGIIKVKGEHSPDNRVDLFEEFDSILDETSMPSGDRFVMGTILLEEGDML